MTPRKPNLGSRRQEQLRGDIIDALTAMEKPATLIEVRDQLRKTLVPTRAGTGSGGLDAFQIRIYEGLTILISQGKVTASRATGTRRYQLNTTV